MVSISQYTRLCKNGIWIVTGTETILCPFCGGRLFVRGTCRRLLRRADETQETYRLRVLQCSSCGRSHRELPDEIVPYKRHDIPSISAMGETPEECIAEPSVRHRLMRWLYWFLSYAAQIAESLRLAGLRTTEPSGDSLRRRLTHFVRLVVNSGNWIQHRSVVTVP